MCVRVLVCVGGRVCVCLRKREREREREKNWVQVKIDGNFPAHSCSVRLKLVEFMGTFMDSWMSDLCCLSVRPWNGRAEIHRSDLRFILAC
jgi:hypothetical protein